MEDLKLSIIIPVYNVENYVEKCLRSCAEQDIPSEYYEIIVVNDGSTDQSIEIINKTSLNYTNFVIINKENGGVSSARNIGLDLAKGKYIWFVDSDDWIEPSCLGNLISVLDENQLDIIQFGYKVTDMKGEILCVKNTVECLDFDVQSYVNSYQFDGHCCVNIFRKNIADLYNVKFNQNLPYFEDSIFFLNILNYSNKIRKIKSNPYNIRMRDDSATATYKEDPYFYCMNEYLKNPPLTYYKLFQQREMCWVFLSFMEISSTNLFDLHKKLKISGYNRIPLLANRSTYNILLRIYNFNGLLGVFLFKLKMLTSNYIKFIR